MSRKMTILALGRVLAGIDQQLLYTINDLGLRQELFKISDHIERRRDRLVRKENSCPAPPPILS